MRCWWCNRRGVPRVFTSRGSGYEFHRPVLCDVCVELLAHPVRGTPHAALLRALAETWHTEERRRQPKRDNGAVGSALPPHQAWAALALVDEMIGYRAELRGASDPQWRAQLEALIDERAEAIKRYLDAATE